jgi:hypothetical protein
MDIFGVVGATNTLTIARAGTDLIAGATSYVLNWAGASAALVSNGSNLWGIISVMPYPTGQLVCEPSTGSAAAGKLGEYVESTLVQASAVALVTNTAKTVTSITLTPGDWDLGGMVYILPAATTSFTVVLGCTNTTTNVLSATNDTQAVLRFAAIAPGTNQTWNLLVPVRRVSISSNTTYYLIAYATFTVSTATAAGRIFARRVR